MKNVLITGATGAVGSGVLNQLYKKRSEVAISVFIRKSKRSKKLEKKFPEVTFFYGDLVNERDMDQAVKNQDYIFHLGAVIPPLADEQPEMAWKVNVEGVRNMVNATQKHAPNALFIFSSSVAIYGDRLKNPDIKVTDPLTPCDDDDYGKSKVAAEKILRESNINWSIFRLSAIMGIGNHKISKLMFHMPLETIMEIATVRDTARAFVNSIGNDQQLLHKTFNLGGGEACRITYEEFVSKAFELTGLGKLNFPEYAFARINFHCGKYIDGNELEEIVHFRQDTIETYFERFKKSVPAIQKFFTIPVRKPVKMYLLSISEPYEAYKKKDAELITRFFGDSYPH